MPSLPIHPYHHEKLRQHCLIESANDDVESPVL
jgi:hypothetical protein